MPFVQAIRLPILLYKPQFKCLNGKVLISNILTGENKIKMGMIRLGFDNVSIYPNSGFTWENHGTVIFKGTANIGNDSFISVGKTGNLILGENFRSTCSLKLACYNKIEFRENVLVGWNCTVTDTDFHSIFIDGNKSKGYGEIHIGKNVWIAMQCLILKNTIIPSDSVVASRTVTNKDFTANGSEIMLSGSPAQVVRHNTFHDSNNDKIDYTL